ncbi:helix-turn-helix domain-containing protein, partial [Rhizobium mongolense]|uniref:helix-turn-helix domain-containing protein n=1 Tax=Rhizobium mongolense TaxID=57676 RepID=UPI003556EB63
MSKYSESLKRTIVEQYLSGDESYRGVGAAHGIDVSTIRTWVASYEVHGAAGGGYLCKVDPRHTSQTCSACA